MDHPKMLWLSYLFALAITPAFADNLVQNSSFEDVTMAGRPVGWNFYMPPPPSDNPFSLSPADVGLYSVDTTVAKTGTHSMRISSPTPVRCSVAQNLHCQAGQKLKISAWIKGENLDVGTNRGAWIRLSFQNPDPGVSPLLAHEQVYLKSTESTFDWTFFSAEVTVPDQAQVNPLECYLWQSKGTVWFDDISVEVQGEPTP